jgi:sulfite exporter TauE/SafE
MPALAAAAFAAGLFGGVHCAGMCGGIVGTLAVDARGPRIGRQLLFNTGRIASYVLVGAAAGALLPAQLALFVVANLFMILLGLYIAGWGRLVLGLERVGAIAWKHIQPFARSLLPIDSPRKALAAGLLWGWVPCGLVYSMLALAAASGTSLDGALVMLAFGVGTLPNLLAAGFAAQKVFALRRLPWVRHGAGAALVLLGIVGLVRVPGLGEALLAGWRCVGAIG